MVRDIIQLPVVAVSLQSPCKEIAVMKMSSVPTIWCEFVHMSGNSDITGRSQAVLLVTHRYKYERQEG